MKAGVFVNHVRNGGTIRAWNISFVVTDYPLQYGNFRD